MSLNANIMIFNLGNLSRKPKLNKQILLTNAMCFLMLGAAIAATSHALANQST